MFNINDVQIIKIGDKIVSDEFKKLVRMWVKDYRASGDKCWSASVIYKCILEKSSDATLVAVLEEKLIGFVTVITRNGINSIVFSYVNAQFRNSGVATKLYLQAIKTLNAEEIELSFKRVKARVPYWKSLGFKSFKKRPGEAYSLKSICYLSLKNRYHSINANPLQIDVLNHFLKYQGTNSSAWEDFIQTSKSINAFENLSLSQFGNVNMQPKSKLKKSS